MNAWGSCLSGVKRLLLSARSAYSFPKLLAGFLAYLLILALYMQPVITNGCNETYLGSPGDQSAFAWLYKASPESPPLWGPTTWTNAPYGENLTEPFYITGLFQYTSVWTIEKVVGPTCAFNLYASFGYLLTATVVLLFVLWLTKTRYYFVAWLAGYLIAFSPYLQIKTTHHVSYVYSGLLVIILWLLIAYWRKPRRSLALAFMTMCATLFYHDPYFIMLGFFLCVAFMLGTAVYHWRFHRINRKQLWLKLKYLVWTLPLFVILVTPVAYTRISQSAHIDLVVGGSRDTNIMAEGKAYSARPWEFFLPATTNPFTPEFLKEFQNSHQHGTDNIETTLFLGYVTMGLAAVYVVHWLKKRRNDHRSIARPQQHATLVAGSLVIVGGLMSLPPYITVGSLTLYFPSWVLLSVTTMWRMPARFFVILQLGLVILATLGLLYVIKRYKRHLVGWRLYLMYAIVLTVSFAEFITFNPLHRKYWSQSMIPSVYQEIKDNASVNLVAEYPMLDPPRNFAFIFYLSYQAYYQKPMINSAKAASPTKKYRESIADVNDWQTVGVLKKLGVDRLVFHGVDSLKVSSPQLVARGTAYDNQTTTPVKTFSIAGSVTPKSYVLTIADGFDGPSNYGFTDIDFFMHQSGVLQPILLPNATKQSVASARIEYYAFEKTPRKVVFEQDGKELAVVYGKEAKQVVEFTLDPNKPIHIVPDNAPTDYSFVISNMEVK